MKKRFNYAEESEDLMLDRLEEAEQHDWFMRWSDHASRRFYVAVGFGEVPFSHDYDAYPAPRLTSPELLQPRFGQWQREAM